ncbi:MAG: glutathione S-transferase [Betaproteobacteria bacterium]|nr:glutathione S-transferase [Betaproteobacteria bacterium]
MLKLRGFRISNYHNKVRLALLEKGIPHEEDDKCMVPLTDEQRAASPMGKVPWIQDGALKLSESQAICEYLEDAYPDKPLYPTDAAARAKVRELMTYLEMHLELVARRLYFEAFFGGKVSDETKKEVERDLAKGVRGLKALVKFDPYIAGKELSYADCAAAVHLPLISMSSKICFGKDALEELPQVKPYLKMLAERPAFRRVGDERKAAMEARMAAAAKK